jgi:hypothetical protein
MTPAKRQSRIDPADLSDKPAVLDTGDLMDILRIGEDRVQELVSSGALHRLDYSRHEIKVFKGEVERFLEEQSGWAS